MKKLILIILLLIPINCFAVKVYKLDNKKIYISNNYININHKDSILIIDNRINNNIKIINSYKIDNKREQENIIDIILKYNKEYPNNKWHRSKSTMKLEWYLHNLLYKFKIYPNRTKSVDFDSSEENFYKLLNHYLQI